MSDSHPEDNKYRSFICPCSKAYLSYPALFTHIKQKHDGKPPGDIIRPRALNKRGRPRKNAGNQVQNQQYTQMPQYKSYASRQLFKSQEQLQLQPAISQLQSAKQRYQANLQFMAPLVTTQLRQLSFSNNIKMEGNQEEISLGGQNHQNIRSVIKDLFEPQHNPDILKVDQLQKLINLNKSYQQIKREDRRSSRRPIGYNSWEMEFKTALLEFLDWSQNMFTNWEFKNIQLLIALTLFFFQEEIEERISPTTLNYIAHLNNLGRYFLAQITKNATYHNAHILQDDRCFKLLAYVHQWLRNQNLTNFTVHFNSKFEDTTPRDFQSASEL